MIDQPHSKFKYINHMSNRGGGAGQGGMALCKGVIKKEKLIDLN